MKKTKIRLIPLMACLSMSLIACQPTSHQNLTGMGKTPQPVALGNLEKCKQYTGLPAQWLQHETAGMRLIPGGSFEIGNNNGYPEEKSLINSKRQIDDFYMDATEVTNAQFAQFVQTTGYVTEAEKNNEAAVFVQPTQPSQALAWWKIEPGISWQYPWGKSAERKILPNEPVRYITLKDAIAYATWLGRDLATEEQWEYAAKGFSQNRDVVANHQGHHINANVWQGEFPYQNQVQDGFADVAPVGCFAANPFGLYDTIGNLWEYTSSPFRGTHDDHQGNHGQLANQKTKNANLYTIKGGSYLCADNYCARYRATARQAQEADLAISHVGFRTVKKLIKDENRSKLAGL